MSLPSTAEGNTTHLNAPEVFFGRTTPAEARVYVRMPRLQAGDNVQLAGTIIGPECRFAHTLPTTIQLRDRGPGDTLLAEAVVPDPCCWTPELPFVYQARIELRRDGQILQQHEQLFGIRRLGVRGRDLFLEGKRWVLRAVRREHVQGLDVSSWREASAAMIVGSPGEALCEQASLAGVLLVAELQGMVESITAELVRLARWPAVGIAIIDAMAPLAADIRRRVPNLILSTRQSGDDAHVDEWAHLYFCDATELPGIQKLLVNSNKPIVAERLLPAATTLTAARAQCDRLQAELAEVSDFAGYVV